MNRELAIFDLDGTITNKDTFIELIKFYHGKLKFLSGFLFLSPVLIAMKLKIISNSRAKEKVIEYFFKGETLEHFQMKCDQFATDILPRLCKTDAMDKILEFKKKGTRIIIITASLENWIMPWTAKNKIELIGTQIECINKILTGKYSGENCYGIEKVNRLRKYLNPEEYQIIIAFGDSRGDDEILQLADIGHYKYFKK